MSPLTVVPFRAASFAAILVLATVVALVPGSGALGGTDGTNAPPTLTLDSPVDGDGVRGTVDVVGTAVDGEGPVRAVRVRIDHRDPVQASLASQGAGQVTPWAVSLDLAGIGGGPHEISASAFDGVAWSAPKTVTIMVGESHVPPRVSIVSPSHGQGVKAGDELIVRGLASSTDGAISRVYVRVGNSSWHTASITETALGHVTWNSRFTAGEVPAGVQIVEALAYAAFGGGDSASAPARITIAAGAAGNAPEVNVLRPASGEGVGVGGDGAACRHVEACLVMEGVARASQGAIGRVHLRVDDGAWIDVGEHAAGDVAPIAPGIVHWRYEWGASDAFRGVHRVDVRALTDTGSESVAMGRVFALDSARHVVLGVADSTVRTRETVTLWAEAKPDGATAANVTWTANGVELGHGTPFTTSFTTPGFVTVQGRFVDGRGHVGLADITLTIINRAPTPGFIMHRSGANGVADPVVFNGTLSTDLDGHITGYRYEYGDGKTSGWIESPFADHLYARAGTYSVGLRVVDDRGAVSGILRRDVTIHESPPFALFTAHGKGSVLEPVAFIDESFDPDGDLAHWSWTFGDGATSTNRSPRHQYTARGTFTVTLTVTDTVGHVSTHSEQVPVKNLPPVAAFRFTEQAYRARDPVTFEDRSHKPDGAILGWAWDFGDGNRSKDRHPTHLFGSRGTFIVSLVITDDFGDQSSTSRSIVIQNAIPESRFDWGPEVSHAGEDVVFRSLARDVDGHLVAHLWSFGDGSTSNKTHPSHRYARPGTYLVGLTVIDDAGARVSSLGNVTITNRIPVAEARDVQAIERQPVTLEGSAVDADGFITEYAWDVDGDGRIDAAGATLRSVRFTYREAGLYHARMYATDDQGAVGIAHLNVTVVPIRDAGPLPEVQVATPTESETLSKVVKVTGSASTQTTRVELQFRRENFVVSLDGDEWSPADGTHAWSYSFDSRHLGNGDYWIVARAIAGDRRGPETSVLVTVDNSESFAEREILLAVEQPRPDEEVRGRVTVRGTAIHNEGVTLVRWRVDDGPWRDATGIPAFRATWDTLDAGNGPHTVTIRAYRGLTTWRDIAIPVVVANVPPTLVVDTPPVAWSVSGSLVFEGHVAELNAREVNVRIDNGPWMNVSGTKTWVHVVNTTLLAEGPHTIAFRAIGTDGVTSAPVERHFTVDRNAVVPGEAGPSIHREKDTPYPGAWALGIVGLSVAWSLRRRDGSQGP